MTKILAVFFSVSILLIAGILIFVAVFKDKNKNQSKKLSYKDKIEKGRKYEHQVFNFFLERGYSAYPKGYIEKYHDGGIDILAYKGSEMLLIQCKNWANSPKQKDIKAFIIDSDEFIKNNQNLVKNKSVRKLFITSNDKQDFGVRKFLDEYNKNNEIKVEYIIIGYTA